MAVAHVEYRGAKPADLQDVLAKGGSVIDIKSCLSQGDFPPDVPLWRL